MLPSQTGKGESRTSDQIRQHYEIEKRLAAKLRNSSIVERQHLYASLYDELFRQVPHHPQLTQKASPEVAAMARVRELRFLRGFVKTDSIFLEVGPGDCGFSFAMAALCKKVYAIDVSAEIARNCQVPPNFELMLSDGRSIPLPANSVDVAYSNQLMEHLHPDDAQSQLEAICRSLAPNGVYVCITPNRIGGPHDISKYYDPIASGFHLKEYTYRELHDLLKRAGFSSTRAYVGYKGICIRFPLFAIIGLEGFLSRLPFSLGISLARRSPLRSLLAIRLAGTK